MRQLKHQTLKNEYPKHSAVKGKPEKVSLLTTGESCLFILVHYGSLVRNGEVNKRLRTWFFPAGEEPEIGDHPEPDLWGVPNSFFTLNEKWHHGSLRIRGRSSGRGVGLGLSLDKGPNQKNGQIIIYIGI